VLRAGGIPWLSLMHGADGWCGGRRPGGQGHGVVLWLVLFVGLVGAATFAGFESGISARVCPVVAYECPL
jgi:hypothetical protein